MMPEDEGYIVASKVCSVCGETKSALEFYRCRRNKDGLVSQCKECRKAHYKYRPDVAIAQRKYKRRHPKRVARGWRESRWKQSGITLIVEEYDEMLERQGGVCAICGSPETMKSNQGFTRRLSVDHDHRTFRVRGLVCSKCNLALERVDTVPGWMERVRAYLDA